MSKVNHWIIQVGGDISKSSDSTPYQKHSQLPSYIQFWNSNRCIFSLVLSLHISKMMWLPPLFHSHHPPQFPQDLTSHGPSSQSCHQPPKSSAAAAPAEHPLFDSAPATILAAPQNLLECLDAAMLPYQHWWFTFCMETAFPRSCSHPQAPGDPKHPSHLPGPAQCHPRTWNQPGTEFPPHLGCASTKMQHTLFSFTGMRGEEGEDGLFVVLPKKPRESKLNIWCSWFWRGGISQHSPHSLMSVRLPDSPCSHSHQLYFLFNFFLFFLDLKLPVWSFDRFDSIMCLPKLSSTSKKK